MRYYFWIFLVVLLLVIPWFAVNHSPEFVSALKAIGKAGDQLAAVLVSHDPKTVAEIQAKYNSRSKRTYNKVRILIVPGHEPGMGGAEFGSLKEREMVNILAEELRSLLSGNERYEVFITRTSYDWSSIFRNYFQAEWQNIIEWQKAHKDEITELARLGRFVTKPSSVLHNTAPEDIALRLYGIGKWANENDIDIVLHVHFNDYPRRNMRTPGEYSGIAIYVPENEYYNSTTTKALADTVFRSLTKYNAVSNLRGEREGIVEDQDLIAIGAYNSLNAASMLIEYGYIYEPQFTNEDLRNQAIKDLAYQTYLGLQDFFGDSTRINSRYDTLVIPHNWASELSESRSNPLDVYALQTAFLLDGIYPPNGETKNDCPRTGKFGPCTKEALSAFQDRYSITGEKGIVGPKTLEVLNGRFSRN